MHRRHAISPVFSYHCQDVGISRLKGHDYACSCILSVVRVFLAESIDSRVLTVIRGFLLCSDCNSGTSRDGQQATGVGPGHNPWKTREEGDHKALCACPAETHPHPPIAHARHIPGLVRRLVVKPCFRG